MFGQGYVGISIQQASLGRALMCIKCSRPGVVLKIQRGGISIQVSFHPYGQYGLEQTDAGKLRKNHLGG